MIAFWRRPDIDTSSHTDGDLEKALAKLEQADVQLKEAHDTFKRFVIDYRKHLRVVNEQ